MMGLAVGVWLFPIGLAVFVVAIVGWVYEYYRGILRALTIRQGRSTTRWPPIA